MRKLVEYRKNTHQTHLEDLVLLGRDGFSELNDKIEKFIRRFSSEEKELNLTQKIDGAPALFCWSQYPGYPDNSIALKGFTSGPQNAISSEEQIEAKYGDRPDMAAKLRLGLQLAKYIPAGEAWQGDCLFSHDDIKEEEIDGTKYLTFMPNKIVYAFSENNADYNKVKNCDFGIAFHTIYKDKDGEMRQGFDVDPTRLQAPDNFYIMSPAIDASRDQGDYDVEALNNEYNTLKQCEQKLANDSAYEELISNATFMNYWNTFENATLADKKQVNINVSTFIEELKEYVKDKQTKEYNRKVGALKTTQGVEKATAKYNADVEKLENIIESHRGTLVNLVEALNAAANIKMLMWGGLKKAKNDYSTYYKSRTKGYIPAEGEGIAMSDMDGNIVKIVDRSTFSSYNRDPDIMSGFEHEGLDIAATQRNDMGTFNKKLILDEDAGRKAAVIAFGRLNPPTIGHEKLINTVADVAKANDAEPMLFLSHSVNPKKDPLSYESKVKWCEKAFGDRVNVVNTSAINALQALSELYKDGYTDVIYVGGSDRIGGADDMTNTIKKYNGGQTKTGETLYRFDSINFVNAGMRDADSDDPSSKASASLVRRLVIEDNFDEFEKFVPFDKKDSMALFKELKYAMKGKEEAFYKECLLREESLREHNLIEAELNGDRLKRDPELRNELEKELDKIDPKLDVPDLDKGLDDYKTDPAGYQGLFVKQGSSKQVSFSNKDVRSYANKELNKSGDEVAKELKDLEVVDNKGKEYKLHDSGASLAKSNGGLSWNDKKEVTYYQEAIMMLLLTNTLKYNGDLIEYLANSDREAGTGVFTQIYPYNKSKVRSNDLFKQYWSQFIKEWAESFKTCLEESFKFESAAGGILETNGSLIPLHDGIRSKWHDEVEIVLSGADTVDKSDAYVVPSSSSSEIDTILKTMIKLKGNPVEYVKFVSNADILGVSLKKNEGSLNIEYDIPSVDASELSPLSFKSSPNGCRISFNIGDEGVALDIRSANKSGSVMTEFRPKKGAAAFGKATTGMKTVLGDRYEAFGKLFNGRKFRDATRYLIMLLTGEKDPIEDTLYELTPQGSNILASIFNFAAGRPFSNERGERITAPYIKVY